MARTSGVKSSKFHIWSSEEKDYLREITSGRHYKEIVELMNAKFEYEFNIGQIKGAIARHKLNTGFTGHFPKGNIPFNKGTKGLMKANKTSYKKGNIPQTYKPVGTERITKDGYTEIKVKDPNVWKLKHRIIYEEHYGEIPKGYVVMFLDRDKSNFDINNLILISRNQLKTLNQNDLIKDDPELTKSGIILADLLIKINEKDKEIKKNGED